MNKMVKLDPVTGPLSREEFSALVGLPHGKAAECIRKTHDPFWGLPEGATIEWEVRCKRDDEGVAYVHAASRKEAEKLVDDLTVDDVEWDEGADFEILSIEPYIEPKKLR